MFFLAHFAGATLAGASLAAAGLVPGLVIPEGRVLVVLKPVLLTGFETVLLPVATGCAPLAATGSYSAPS